MLKFGASDYLFGLMLLSFEVDCEVETSEGSDLILASCSTSGTSENPACSSNIFSFKFNNSSNSLKLIYLGFS
jgi:hypothetical protein